MPELEGAAPDIESQLFSAIADKNLSRVQELVKSNPKFNINCLDKDELTPLQHACHLGDLEITEFLLDNGADINFTRRKDGYTPLMFAAITSRADVVKLLLEKGVDITKENCVNRNAAQMAAFVGQSRVVAIINGWVPYCDSVEPFTKVRELEDKPRIESVQLGKLLHKFIVYPSLHPIKLILFIAENPDLVKHSAAFTYVLENLSSKSLKPPCNEESLSLKYYYLSYLIQYCSKLVKLKHRGASSEQSFDSELCQRTIENFVRRLIKHDDIETTKPCTQLLDKFILECLMKYPYTQAPVFKTMTLALAKREASDISTLSVLMQTLDGPRMFAQPAEACTVCGELDKNKKCSKCKSAYYCTQACQRADWFQHKRVCKDPEEQPLLQKKSDD